MAAVSTVADTSVFATAQLGSQAKRTRRVWVLGYQPALQRFALVPCHAGYVERTSIGRSLSLRLLQLAPVDELNVSDPGPGPLGWLAFPDPGPQGG